MSPVMAALRLGKVSLGANNNTKQAAMRMTPAMAVARLPGMLSRILTPSAMPMTAPMMRKPMDLMAVKVLPPSSACGMLPMMMGS
jgi:hypothetical protein